MDSTMNLPIVPGDFFLVTKPFRLFKRDRSSLGFTTLKDDILVKPGDLLTIIENQDRLFFSRDDYVWPVSYHGCPWVRRLTPLECLAHSSNEQESGNRTTF